MIEKRDQHSEQPTADLELIASKPVIEDADEGGESACWAQLVCPECGSIGIHAHRPSS
jgi:hypothetical protein